MLQTWRAARRVAAPPSHLLTRGKLLRGTIVRSYKAIWPLWPLLLRFHVRDRIVQKLSHFTGSQILTTTDSTCSTLRKDGHYPCSLGMASDVAQCSWNGGIIEYAGLAGLIVRHR
jgi:hypothetical protein